MHLFSYFFPFYFSISTTWFFTLSFLYMILPLFWHPKHYPSPCPIFNSSPSLTISYLQSIQPNNPSTTIIFPISPSPKTPYPTFSFQIHLLSVLITHIHFFISNTWSPYHLLCLIPCLASSTHNPHLIELSFSIGTFAVSSCLFPVIIT